MIIIYRIEHRKKGNGMWYSADGEYNPFVKNMKNQRLYLLPMPFKEELKVDSINWLCGVKSKKQLTSWFHQDEMIELINGGYAIYEIEVSEMLDQEVQILYNPENIICKKELSVKDIFKDININRGM